MADAKLSALTEDAALAGTAQLYVNDGGTSKRITGTNLATSVLTLLGVTSTAAELNILDGVTSTAAELNVLDGIPATLTATELGYVDGVTSAIQTQLNGKAATTHTEPAASTTAAGHVEQSTSAENIAGTSDAVFPSVAGVKAMVTTHGALKALVSFNGSGVVAINGTPLNVASITDNGVGRYTINFTTAISGSTYTWFATVRFGIGGAVDADTKTTAALKVGTMDVAGNFTDYTEICVGVFI